MAYLYFYIMNINRLHLSCHVLSAPFSAWCGSAALYMLCSGSAQDDVGVCIEEVQDCSPTIRVWKEKQPCIAIIAPSLSFWENNVAFRRLMEQYLILAKRLHSLFMSFNVMLNVLYIQYKVYGAIPPPGGMRNLSLRL